MTRCPHCKAKAMTSVRKSFLGPAQSTSCRKCGKRVCVSFAAMFALIPFILAIIVADSLFYSSPVLAAGALLAGFVATVYIHVAYAPLVPA